MTKQPLLAKRAYCKALHIAPFNGRVRSSFIEFLSSYFPNDSKGIWQAVKSHRPSPINRDVN